jgi:hypothetical protein
MQTARLETEIINMRAKVRWNTTTDGYVYKITLYVEYKGKGKGKSLPLQAWTGLEGG